MKAPVFEGSEKKLELILSPLREPLRNQPDQFWRKLCQKAETKVVSHFSNSFCDSYILSESSLFVWDHHLLMLTCGNTSLVSALLSLLKKFKKSDRDLLFYQRKNEFFPYRQKSSFRDDLQKIQKKIKGQAWCFGPPDGHHFYLFHSEGEPVAQPDRTIEILMYDLDNSVKDLFFQASQAEEIRNHLKLDRIFESAETADHAFEPVGYSLNALMGKKEYYTIHVTPQEPGFYVSFETNKREDGLNDVVEKVLSLFKPLAFDVIVFSNSFQPERLSPSGGFSRSAFFDKNLDCGYKVCFYSFFRPFETARPAFEISTREAT